MRFRKQDLKIHFMLDLEFAELSDTGPTRQRNEDCVGHLLPATPEEARSRGWFFALADGVGGQSRGDVASSIAIESLLVGFRSCPAAEWSAAALTRLVQAANQRVYEAPGKGSASGVIATTAVVCAVRYDRAYIANVGDSRCYLIRRGHANALTRDHTVANEYVRMGVLSGRRASKASTTNLLSRCLGNELIVNVDVSEQLLLQDDILLLCSDGLHRPLGDKAIGEVVSRFPDLHQAAAELIQLANSKDGSDNVSVQLIRIREVERVGMYRGRLYRLP